MIQHDAAAVVNVLVTDTASPSLDIEREILAGVGATVTKGGDADLVARADAVLTCWRPVTPALLDAAPRCRVVARYGVGVDNIDVARATELGIVVTNVPDFCVDEVSDHALALMLALRRKVVWFARQTRAGGWDNAEGTPMRRLRGDTLGVVGFGRTGQALAAKARALGMRVTAFAPSRVGAPDEDGTRFAASLDDLLARADVISLHLPATPATAGLIGRRELASMKPGALLINTARGALVDEVALADALDAGAIGGAGLDVLAQEPPEPSARLLASERAIVTPHAAFFSEQSTQELQRRAAGCVASVLRGQLPESIVNREVLEHPSLRMARP